MFFSFYVQNVLLNTFCGLKNMHFSWNQYLLHCPFSERIQFSPEISYQAPLTMSVAFELPQVCNQEVSTYILGGERSINHKKSILYVAKGAHSTLLHIKTWHSSRNGWNLFLWIGSLLTNSFSGEGNGQMLSRCIPLELFPVWESENYCTCSIIKGSQRNTIAP